MKFFEKSKTNKAVSTEKLKFSYPDKDVLKNISLNVKEGTITAIIGKSGCGKSTFLKLLAGIISKQYEGNIWMFGKKKNKKVLGFVPQDVSVIPDLSISDNIEIAGNHLGLFTKDVKNRSAELLQMLKIEENLNKTPNELSGGQKVRLNILLSILHDPELLILDEPFVGLDFQNRRLLWHFLESQKRKNKTVLLTSHLLAETQEHVDRIIILKDGRVFYEGKVDALKEKLNVKYIMELRFSFLSKDSIEKIEKYCLTRDIKILDSYEKYLMLSLKAAQTKDAILRLLDSLNLKYEIIGYREPNLDEIFLGA